MALTHSTAPRTAPPKPIDDAPPMPEQTLLRAGAALSDERAREVACLLDRWRSRSFDVEVADGSTHAHDTEAALAGVRDALRRIESGDRPVGDEVVAGHEGRA